MKMFEDLLKSFYDFNRMFSEYWQIILGEMDVPTIVFNGCDVVISNCYCLTISNLLWDSPASVYSVTMSAN